MVMIYIEGNSACLVTGANWDECWLPASAVVILSLLRAILNYQYFNLVFQGSFSS
jgi:hypothetical protein